MSKFALKLYVDQVAKLSLPESSLQKWKNSSTWFQWCTCPRTPRYMEYLWCCHQWSLEDVLHNSTFVSTVWALWVAMCCYCLATSSPCLTSYFHPHSVSVSFYRLVSIYNRQVTPLWSAIICDRLLPADTQAQYANTRSVGGCHSQDYFPRAHYAQQ